MQVLGPCISEVAYVLDPRHDSVHHLVAVTEPGCLEVGRPRPLRERAATEEAVHRHTLPSAEMQDRLGHEM